MNNLQLKESDTFPDQVDSWLFPAAVTTHLLLTAGLKNPTVRRRYVTTKKLLKEYKLLEFYPKLLKLIGCADISRKVVEYHLEQLTEIFDKAKEIKTSFFFASDISDIARPISIGGSWKMVEQGFHREAIFWIVATFSRCQKIFIKNGSTQIEKWSEKRYRDLVSELGIYSFSDLKYRQKQVKEFVPVVWEIGEEIIKVNSEIEK
ncbi:MAG: hypothetical protein ACOCQS_02250 [Bacillota bacterium]